MTVRPAGHGVVEPRQQQRFIFTTTAPRKHFLWTRIGFQLGITPENVDIADLDGDGTPDMVVAIGPMTTPFCPAKHSANWHHLFWRPIAFALLSTTTG
jgi:hypothetical protein